jgi:outer membrane lipoprotein-sorting protein
MLGSIFQVEYASGGASLVGFFVVFWMYNPEQQLYSKEMKSAREILDQSINIYANCKNYLDSGKQDTLFIRKDSKRLTSLSFLTAFERPSKFRFEFQRSHRKPESYIVWRSGKSIKTWWTINKPHEEVETKLRMAVAGATGVSGGTAALIPRLLMPKEIDYYNLGSLRKPLLCEEEISNTKTYKLTENNSKGEKLVIWIDQERLLIVKVFETTMFKDFQTETTTIYHPEIDTDIPPKMFDFNPPTAKG